MENVLITGGSEGIGRALADLYAARGYGIVLVARNEERLREACGQIHGTYHVPAVFIAADLSEAGSAARLYEKVTDSGLPIAILINNAGMGTAGVSWQQDLEKEERLVALNDIALMSLDKLFLREMIAAGSGTILNIASMAAFQPGPYMAAYYASKAFVVNYTRAIAEEARGKGVRIACYCPGQVDTGFFEKAGSQKTHLIISSQKAAEEAVRLLATRRTVLIPGAINHIMRLFPEGLKVRVLSQIKKQR